MNPQQQHALTLRDTDVEGAMYRLGGDEAVYRLCLRAFLEDSTMRALNQSVRDENWDDAFTAAHALKGVAGNMGFIPLMHSVGQLVVLIRGGHTREVDESLEQVNSSYRDIVDGIHQYFALADERGNGEGNDKR